MAQSNEGVSLSRRKYVLDILEDTGLLGARPVETPMDPNVKLCVDQRELLHNPNQYRRLVGKLNYLTITRPDISFAISLVSQFMPAPHHPHWEAFLRIVKYLKLHPGWGLLYRTCGHLRVEAFTDSDWAGGPSDRRSTTGYRAMTHTTCEVVWLRSFLEEIGFSVQLPISLYCDNLAAIHIASNPVFHKRTKHIEVDCHLVREKLTGGVIATPYVSTGAQLADMFTKSLFKPRLEFLCDKLGAWDFLIFIV